MCGWIAATTPREAACSAGYLGDQLAPVALGDAVEVTEQRLPLHVVQDGAGVVAVGAGGGSEHDDAGAGGEARVDEGVDLREGVVARVVQDDRQEPADGLETVALQEGCLGRRILGQEAVGAELGGGEAERAHLGQDAIGGHLVAPAGHLAHAPRDGGSGDAEGVLALGFTGRRHGFLEFLFVVTKSVMRVCLTTHRAVNPLS